MDDAENGDEETLYSETTERFWSLCLVTRVREDGIYVRLEPLQRAHQRIQPDNIQKVSVTSYKATTYAGWHWGMRRTPSGNTVYRLRGNRGVEIRLKMENPVSSAFNARKRSNSLLRESYLGQDDEDALTETQLVSNQTN